MRFIGFLFSTCQYLVKSRVKIPRPQIIPDPGENKVQIFFWTNVECECVKSPGKETHKQSNVESRLSHLHFVASWCPSFLWFFGTFTRAERKAPNNDRHKPGTSGAVANRDALPPRRWTILPAGSTRRDAILRPRRATQPTWLSCGWPWFSTVLLTRHPRTPWSSSR